MDLEIYSQAPVKKLREHLAQCPLAKHLHITEIASSRTDVPTGTDAPLLRIYITKDEPIDTLIDILQPFRKTYEIQIMPHVTRRLLKRNR